MTHTAKTIITLVVVVLAIISGILIARFVNAPSDNGSLALTPTVTGAIVSPTLAPSPTATVVPTQTPVPSESPTQGGFKTFTDQGFVDLYNATSLPFTEEISEPPLITSNAEANNVIIEIATNRGYSLQATPTQPLASFNGYAMHPEVLDSWNQMREAASLAGINLDIVSAYRSIEQQQALFLQRLNNASVQAIGREHSNEEIAAGEANDVVNSVLESTSIPGYSRHHTGYALDLIDRSSGLDFTQFSQTEGFEWISANNYENAKRFGFIPSYPADAVAQGPDAEPWEYTWVGVDLLRN